MIEHYAVRVDGRLAELTQSLEGNASIGQTPRPVPVRTAEAMLAAIREASMVPERGRPKDFARLKALVDRLHELGQLA